MHIAFPSLNPSASAPPQTAAPRAQTLFETRTAGPPIPIYQPSVQPASFAGAMDQDAAAPKADKSLTFGDFLDIINPLQHIPLLNLAYRKLTGDEIGGMAQVIGGGLFGGPIGFVAGTAGAIVTHETGQSLPDATVSALLGDLPRAHSPYVDITASPTKRYNFNQSV